MIITIKRTILLTTISFFLYSCKSSMLNWKHIDGSEAINSTIGMGIDDGGVLWISSWRNFPKNLYKLKSNGAMNNIDAPWETPTPYDAPDQICAGNAVWITTFEGNVFRYDLTNSWSGPFDIDPNENTRYWCYTTPNGDVLIWSHNWIKIFSSKSNTPQTTYLESGNEIIQAKIDVNGNLWALTDSGEYYKQEEEKWIYQDSISLREDEYPYNFWILENHVWLATSQRLYKIEDGKKQEVLKNDDDSYIEEIIYDSNERIWIFKSNGALRTEQSGKTTVFKYPAKLDYQIAFDTTTEIVYISTVDGIYFLNIGTAK